MVNAARTAAMQQISYNVLFRCFVGLATDVPVWDVPVWDVTVFPKKRDRLLQGDIASGFLAAILVDAQVESLLSNPSASAAKAKPAAASGTTGRKPLHQPRRGRSRRRNRQSPARCARRGGPRSPPRWSSRPSSTAPRSIVKRVMLVVITAVEGAPVSEICTKRVLHRHGGDREHACGHRARRRRSRTAHRRSQRGRRRRPTAAPVARAVAGV